MVYDAVDELTRFVSDIVMYLGGTCMARPLFLFLFVMVEKRVLLFYHKILRFWEMLIADDKLEKRHGK